MKREEKLSFWINIHNALVMHVCIGKLIFPSSMASSETFVLKYTRFFSGQGTKNKIVTTDKLPNIEDPFLMRPFAAS